MLTGSRVPSAMGAPLRSRGRMPFAFGTRFFVALLLGLIWLVPAWWSPKLIAAMFLWDAFVLAAWLIDLRRLPAPRQLEARRIWKSPLSLGRGSSARIDLRNSSEVPIRASVIDETP